MKKIILSVSSFLMLSIMSSALYAAVKVGDAAADFSLVAADGKTYSLSDYSGKKVILEWTNHECPFVKKHYGSGNMQALQEKYTKQGVVWFSVISSVEGKQGYVSAEKANELTASRNAKPSAVLFDADGKVGKLYGAKTTPHMYIIDEQGVLQYNGAIDSIPSADKADIEQAENYVDSAMAALAAGKPIESSLTRPYGCSVKY